MENAQASENSQKIQTESSSQPSTETSTKHMTSDHSEAKQEHQSNGVAEIPKDSSASQLHKDDVVMEEHSNKEATKHETTKEESEEKSEKESEADPSSHDQPASPRDGRPKRERKPSSLLGEDYETGDSLGGRKTKSPTPPQSPIPLSQRRKKHSNAEGKESGSTEGGIDVGDASDAANELVKLASTATSESGDEEEKKEIKEEKSTDSGNKSEGDEFYKEEENEPLSPMSIEPMSSSNQAEASEDKKRKRNEYPVPEEEGQSGDNDSRTHPKKIRFKYRDEEASPVGPGTPTGTPTKDPLQRMERLEKEARDEKQKRKQVEEENAQLRAEIRSLKKQIADLSKTTAAPAAPVVFSKIEGNDTFITDERFKKCHKILLSLMKHKFGHIFNEPVDPVRLNIPDYHEVIRNPMDFGTIKLRLEGGKYYRTLEEFIADMMLVFSNAKLYNGQGEIWNMTDTLEKTFEKKMVPAVYSGDIHRIPIPSTTPTPSTPVIAPVYYAPPPPPPAENPEMSRMMKQLADMQAAMINMQTNFEAMKKEKQKPVTPPANFYRERERVRDLSPELPRDRVPRKREVTQKIERPHKVERPSPKPVKEAPLPPPPVDEDALLASLNFADKRLTKCYKILSQIKKHKYSYPFMVPVDPVRDGAPNYFEIIKSPMDFGTITKNLEALKYENIEDFTKDMYLVFSNAKTYNPVGSDIYVMADTLQKVFERKMAAEKLDVKAPNTPVAEGESTSMDVTSPTTPPATSTPPPQKKSEDLKNMASTLKEMKDSMKQAKEIIGELKTGAPTKQKLSTPKAEPVELKPMSFEEKYALSQKLSELSPDQLGNVVQIIKEHQPNLVQEPTGEIEINLDILDTAALRHLEKFVNECENRDKKKASKKQNRTGSGSESESDTSSESDG